MTNLLQNEKGALYMKKIWYYEFSTKDKKISAYRLGIAETDGAISHILFESKNSFPGYAPEETPLIKTAALQLFEYFYGKRAEFELPLSPKGTLFQQAVWTALKNIPFGETRSYKQIAEQIGNPKAVRAVGMANNRNPVPIIVPCHRVIGTNGELVGYAGGLDFKQALLDLEKSKKH